MYIKTTEAKLRKAKWKKLVDGYFNRLVGGTRVILCREDECKYYVIYDDPGSPDGLIIIANELKRLEVK